MANVWDLCRLCVNRKKSTVCLNDKDVDDIKYIDKLTYIGSDMVLKEDKSAPYKICSNCCKKLKQSYDFKKQCSSSYNYWHVYFQHNKLRKNAKIATTQIKILEEGQPPRRRGRPPKKLNSVIYPVITVLPESHVSDIKSGATLKIKEEPNSDSDVPLNDVKPNVINMKNKLSSIMKVKEEPNSIMKIKKEPVSELDSFIPVNNDIKPNVINLKNKLNSLLKIDNTSTNVLNPPIKLNFLSLKNKLGVALKSNVEYVEKEKRIHKTKPKIAKKIRKLYYTNHIFYIINAKKKTYYCNSCKKRCKNIKSLKYHINKDLRIKNLSCDICQKHFFYLKTLQNHLKIIHGKGV